MATIVIDPGHGGTRPEGKSTPLGVVGPTGLREKDVTLLIATRLAARLGGSPVLTRRKDENLALEKRVGIARLAGAKLFLSIHANSGRQGARGAEVWVHERSGPESAALAKTLAQRLQRLGGRAEVRRGPMAVLEPDHHLRGAAACLVEVDRLSDHEGERRLRDPEALDRIVAGLAEGARAAFGRGEAVRSLDEGSGKYPQIPPTLRDELKEWTKRVLEGTKTIGTVAEIIGFWTEAASSFSVAAVEVALPAIVETVMAILGPVGVIIGGIIVIAETIRAFGTGRRRQYQKGYCYGLMWRSLDIESQIPVFLDWFNDSADELREAFVNGVNDGRMRALDTPVRNRLLLLVAAETAKGEVSPSLAPQRVLQQLWYHVREHVPGDSESEWPLGWPRPDDMRPIGS
jgi:hypothetical protein